MSKDLYQYNDIAFKGHDSILKIQEQLLKRHFKYCQEQSPFYKKFFKKTGHDSLEITLDRLKQIPFTEKSDIEAFNDDFCAVQPSQIVDIVLSSGTIGNPIKIMYTDFDLKRLAYNEKKSFEGSGLTSEDVVLLTCTMDRCFIAGLAYFLGITSLGAAVIRNGHGSLDSHREVIRRMKPTVIVGVPTFIKKLGVYMQQEGADPSNAGIDKIICIGEPLRNDKLELLEVGAQLQEIWQAKVFSTYASSETITTFCECAAMQGGHLHPDLAIVEIIDEDGNVLSEGEIGEVVVTPLAVEGMPLIRYKTGDLSFLINTPCSCGRNSSRLGPILGRKKQMMKVKGTTLYPQAVYAALDGIKAVEEYYLEVTKESELSDSLNIYVAVNDGLCDESMLQEKLQSKLRVTPTIILKEKDFIKKKVYIQENRKPVRFFDRRECA
ncbi:Coenzyme A ligase [hydrothermal vent metagenome]|uniref:Coenzyme A ligase n=1 Tax=hydrothermal vent metagenome TaxID=652676 RepID=A0A3B1DJ53_9ZZZZ